MPLDVKHNLVTFTVSDWEPPEEAPRIVLNGCSIARRGGLEPDVWQAVVPYSELDRITGGSTTIVGEIPGVVELWHTAAPGAGAADVTIGNCAIVDVTAATIGVVAGESVPRVVDYRLAIADHRRAFVPPRGGLLFDGLVNPEPDPEVGGIGPYPIAELIEFCTAAMGVSASLVFVQPPEPPRNLRWDGAHAASELQGLLEHAGLVYAPLLSGQAQVVKPGTAAAPAIPAGRLVGDVVASSVDRRSGVVVFTSCPAPKIRSFNEDVATADKADWRYVGQDPTTGEWLPLAELPGLAAPAAAYAEDFASVDEADRAAYRAQVYRCIQLDTDAFPPGRVRLLSRYVDLQLIDTPPGVSHADLLVRGADGGYFKGDGFAVAVRVDPAANVLIFDQPLMKLASAGATTRRQRLTRGEVCIPEGDLKPWFSAEGYDDASGRREYGVYGASVNGATVSPLSEATARAQLSGYRPNVSIFNAPDLVNVILNGGTVAGDRNTEAMQARAETYAASAMGVAVPPLRVITVKGFLAVELDACVSEVAYDPDRVTTTITCNGWHATARTAGAAVDVGGVG